MACGNTNVQNIRSGHFAEIFHPVPKLYLWNVTGWARVWASQQIFSANLYAAFCLLLVTIDTHTHTHIYMYIFSTYVVCYSQSFEEETAISTKYFQHPILGALDTHSTAPSSLHFQPAERISSRKPPAVMCLCEQLLWKKTWSNRPHFLLISTSSCVLVWKWLNSGFIWDLTGIQSRGLP